MPVFSILHIPTIILKEVQGKNKAACGLNLDGSLRTPNLLMCLHNA